MKRPVMSARSLWSRTRRPRGYTLVEILVATVLTLILVAAVVQIFGSIGDSIADSRATLEMSDRLRAAKTKLQMDLAGATATMLPPLRPEAAEGYFEYIEGRLGPVKVPSEVAVNTDDPAAAAPDTQDTTVADFDDRIMWTTRSTGRPFIGRCAAMGGTVESDVAEVAWFVRGRTLYRRVLLVAPGVDLSTEPLANFFADNDISIHLTFDGSGKPASAVANSLADLTKRECRYAHRLQGKTPFPFDARNWGQLGLPTLRECSSPAWLDWDNDDDLPGVAPLDNIDLWNNPHPWPNVDPVTGALLGYEGPRVAEDVVLTNVIGFDVKVWDPGTPNLLFDVEGTAARADDVVLTPEDPRYAGALGGAIFPGNEPAYSNALASGTTPVAISFGAYVDLGYENSAYDPAYMPAPGVPAKRFYHVGVPASGLSAAGGVARVYDTWSLHYEQDGINQDGLLGADQGTNGFDDDGNGIVDDPGEMETSPPYPAPLSAIQVKIRVYEPDSRQIREVTVVQEFLPK